MSTASKHAKPEKEENTHDHTEDDLEHKSEAQPVTTDTADAKTAVTPEADMSQQTGSQTSQQTGSTTGRIQTEFQNQSPGAVAESVYDNSVQGPVQGQGQVQGQGPVQVQQQGPVQGQTEFQNQSPGAVAQSVYDNSGQGPVQGQQQGQQQQQYQGSLQNLDQTPTSGPINFTIGTSSAENDFLKEMLECQMKINKEGGPISMDEFFKRLHDCEIQNITKHKITNGLSGLINKYQNQSPLTLTPPQIALIQNLTQLCGGGDSGFDNTTLNSSQFIQYINTCIQNPQNKETIKQQIGNYLSNNPN